MTRDVLCLKKPLSRLLLPLLFASLTACEPGGGPAVSAPPTTAMGTESTLFTCRFLLIGTDQDACREDVIGPGILEISFDPDPPQGSWAAGIRGLVPLAEVCEFHGSFDQTRLSTLQGRGKTRILCPVSAEVERAYHEIQVKSKDPAPNSSIAVTVRMVRTAS